MMEEGPLEAASSMQKQLAGSAEQQEELVAAGCRKLVWQLPLGSCFWQGKGGVMGGERAWEAAPSIGDDDGEWQLQQEEQQAAATGN
jgi:hypothetical protein